MLIPKRNVDEKTTFFLDLWKKNLTDGLCWLQPCMKQISKRDDGKETLKADWFLTMSELYDHVLANTCDMLCHWKYYKLENMVAL
jgi:hypothetical protein